MFVHETRMDAIEPPHAVIRIDILARYRFPDIQER